MRGDRLNKQIKKVRKKYLLTRCSNNIYDLNKKASIGIAFCNVRHQLNKYKSKNNNDFYLTSFACNET